jgi:glycosyltransferase involved in cell wall biosynthesis
MIDDNMGVTNAWKQVTVVVPTFDRPELLARALKSIAMQTYGNIEVVVCDNGTDTRAHTVLEETGFPPRTTRYIKHLSNVGPINNFMHGLQTAHGEYFMWLADDDEISDCEYITSLVAILEADSKASTAVANWRLMGSPSEIIPCKMREYANESSFVRVARFVWWSSDDFFYGLHRTDHLRNARYLPYWSINNGSILNWAYPFLLDMVIQGKVVGVRRPDTVWINHNYTLKSHAIKPDRLSLGIILSYILRRLNVHYLYGVKIFNQCGLGMLTAIIPISIASLILEFCDLLLQKLCFRKN